MVFEGLLLPHVNKLLPHVSMTPPEYIIFLSSPSSHVFSLYLNICFMAIWYYLNEIGVKFNHILVTLIRPLGIS